MPGGTRGIYRTTGAGVRGGSPRGTAGAPRASRDQPSSGEHVFSLLDYRLFVPAGLLLLVKFNFSVFDLCGYY